MFIKIIKVFKLVFLMKMFKESNEGTTPMAKGYGFMSY
jgi:hypothetical protein